jgi:UDP-N-acetyl-2-amino-2-deoxyglucuronate dehydrogenase
MEPKNFALVGVGGYIAPRHLEAIKATGNNLVAAYDIGDSVGILDRYFDDVDFFTEFERFDRHIDKRRHENNQHIDYVSVCTPNYLHDAHIRFGLRNDAHVICEKPLVLNERNLNGLLSFQDRFAKQVYTILQLREHDAVKALKQQVDTNGQAKKFAVDLHYITPRGKWYDFSWKGDIEKSGGVGTNIGVHFFDMLSWVFGDVEYAQVHINEPNKKMAGFLSLEKANVRWYLSIDKQDLALLGREDPSAARALTINNEEFDFSKGFTDLHTKVYEQILAGNGYGLEDARASISLVEKLRNMPSQKPFSNDLLHPLSKSLLQK